MTAGVENIDGTKQSPRYEIKYILEPAHILWFEHWLRQQPLITATYPLRRVNSVYFDSLGFKAAEENIKGLPDRNKIRVRGYGHDSDAHINSSLEIKSKQGRLGTKRTFKLGQTMNNFHHKAPKEMDQSFKSDPLVRKELAGHHNLFPSIYVGYSREYYVDARGIRITVDRDLEFKNLMYAPNHQASGIARYNKHIVEFKFPPAIKDTAGELMSTLSLYPVRSSKYLIGLSTTGKAVYI